jgi:hypothetical protein
MKELKTWTVHLDIYEYEKQAEWVEVENGCLVGYKHAEHTGNITLLWAVSPGAWTSVRMKDG